MNRILSFLLIICLLSASLSANAEYEQKEYKSGGYTYIIQEDGTAEIRHYKGGEETLSIPHYLDGRKVTSIGSFSFYNDIGIIDVIIPEGVTSIGDYAFAWSPGLRSVMIPDSVKDVGANPFMRCMSLRFINVSPDHPYLSMNDGVLFSKPDKKIVCYPFTLYAEEYILPSGTEIIGDAAFAESNLISVTIPESVREVGDNPFFRSGASTSIEIHISPNHPYLELIDGVLFSKQDKRLICYPCDSEFHEYMIPQGTTLIGNYAFYYCSNLTGAEIPDSVLTIGDYAFCYCESLTSITIPGTVTAIGCFAFDNYRDLTLTIDRNSYAEQYCKDNDLSFCYSEGNTISAPHYKLEDIVAFGNYEQDNNLANGKEPIEWLVLDIQSDKVLLISRYVLDCSSYHSSLKDITWENCNLRAWLNYEFLNTAFTAAEQEQIIVSAILPDKNPRNSTDPGNITNDKVFILSYHEAAKYFTSDNERKCAPTAYVKALEVYDYDYYTYRENYPWWLRSPSYAQFLADWVTKEGWLHDEGAWVSDEGIGIRPAIWVSAEAIEFAGENTPERSLNDLQYDLLGAQTTRYTDSGENRCYNIRLATSMVNGIVLYPGETFSFNDVVNRTEEAGFLPAPAYADVKENGVNDEIGGGACQVSSTLYAATIYAFLETVERTAHIYPVNYIQMGTDATVTISEEGGQVMDLKFKNNKNYPIKIVGYTEENEEEKCVTFEIWGILEDEDYMPVEFDNSWYWILDYDRVIEPAYPDRQGYKIKLTHETYAFEDAIGYGSRTLTHREVYKADTGELVLDEIINPQISGDYVMDKYFNR